MFYIYFHTLGYVEDLMVLDLLIKYLVVSKSEKMSYCE